MLVLEGKYYAKYNFMMIDQILFLQCIAIVIRCNRMNHLSVFKGKVVVLLPMGYAYICAMCSVYCLHQSLSEQTSSQMVTESAAKERW